MAGGGEGGEAKPREVKTALNIIMDKRQRPGIYFHL